MNRGALVAKPLSALVSIEPVDRRRTKVGLVVEIELAPCPIAEPRPDVVNAVNGISGGGREPRLPRGAVEMGIRSRRRAERISRGETTKVGGELLMRGKDVFFSWCEG